MQQLSDERLVAFLDGELTATEAEELEALLAGDAERRNQYDRLAASAVRLRRTFDDVLHEPVPDFLIATVRAANPQPEVFAAEVSHPVVTHMMSSQAVADLHGPDRSVTRARRFLGARRWVPVALAASVCGLVIGAGGGYWGSFVEADRDPSSQVVSAATGNLLDNLAGYYKLLHGGATEAAYDIPGDGAGPVRKPGPAGQAEFKVPDLKPWGVSFQGARMIVVEGEPAAQLSYKADKTLLGPLTVVMFTSKRPDVTPRIEQRQGVNLMYWRHAGKAVAIVGTFDKNYMWKLANDVGYQLGAF